MAEQHAQPSVTSDPTVQEALELMGQIAVCDHEIAQLEVALAALPGLLAALAGHPVLWLLLGREGIDRPGGAWSALVGQQVLTVPQREPWLLITVALVGGLIGIGIGLGLGLVGWAQ